MVIDHIGLVVKSINKGIEQWRDSFGYSQATNIVTNKRQKVKVVFLEKNGSIPIKLTEPFSEDSPVYRFAKRGGGLHHLCFKCEQINDEIARLKSLGLKVITQPEPGEAFDNEKIAFLFAKHGLNIELIDTDKKAERLLSDLH